MVIFFWDWITGLFGGSDTSSDVDDLLTDDSLFGSGIANSSSSSDSSFGSSIDYGKLLTGVLGGATALGTAELSKEDPALTEAKINQINALIDNAKQELELQRERLAFEQQKAGFNADLQKKQLEVQLALAAIDKAQQSVPNRTEQLAIRQQNIQQGTQDTGQVLRALEGLTSRFQSGVK